MAFLLWTFFVNLILRSLFGLPLPLSPFDYRNRKTILQFLTLSQSVIYGVLHFGCGMVIMTTLSRYLKGTFTDHRVALLKRSCFGVSGSGFSEEFWLDCFPFSQVRTFARSNDVQPLPFSIS